MEKLCICGWNVYGLRRKISTFIPAPTLFPFFLAPFLTLSIIIHLISFIYLILSNPLISDKIP